jgi:hypothetical protein
MYTLKDVIRGIRNPEEIRYFFKRQKREQLLRRYCYLTRTLLNRKGLLDPAIPEQDWDNLIILDACRYDLFETCSTLPGDLEAAYSIASATGKFVRKTFKGQTFPDTVCVTANPRYYDVLAESVFHDIVHLWQDEWDDEIRMVPSEVVNQAVVEAQEEYPNKRILAHYIPPHLPFLGETGRKIPHRVSIGGGLVREEDWEEKPHFWNTVASGETDVDMAWRAYRENLELVLPTIADVLHELRGKTVVTSDHGNAFGESGFGSLYRPVYGHPPYKHIEATVKVP